MIDFFKCYRHFSKTRKVPFLLFIFSYFHYIKVNKNNKFYDIDNVLLDNGLIVKYKNIKEYGYLNRNEIIVNKKFEDNVVSKKIIWHEIFHFYELKYNMKVLRIISETSANIFVYYRFMK